MDKQGEPNINCLSEFLSSLDKSTFSEKMTVKFVEKKGTTNL